MFFDFNKNISISFPQDFKNLTEILEDLKLVSFFKSQYQKQLSQSRDMQRRGDVHFIFNLMWTIFWQNRSFFQSEKLPEKIEPFIGEFPKDPGFGPCKNYKWIPNLKDSQKFCFYACLESGKFFAASHKGVKELDQEPKNLDCW